MAKPLVMNARAIVGPRPIVVASSGVDCRGDGTLSGSSPLGLTTVDSAPSSCTIHVFYRHPIPGSVGDRALVAKTISAADGTWSVAGLNRSMRFDVVASKGGYRSVIASDVAPYSAPSTQTITPPSISGSEGWRAGWAEVYRKPVLASLLRFTGADNSTVITDTTGLTWTAFGDAKISASTGPFGSDGALLLDGTGDYIESAAGAQALAGTAPWTIEGWFRLDAYPAAGTSAVLFSRYVSATNRLTIRLGQSITNDSGLRVDLGNATATAIAGHAAQTNTLAAIGIALSTTYHYSVCFDGLTVRVLLNGVPLAVTQAAAAVAAGLGGTSLMRYGRYFDTTGSFTGRIAGARITYDLARYIGYSAVPNAPLTGV